MGGRDSPVESPGYLLEVAHHRGQIPQRDADEDGLTGIPPWQWLISEDAHEFVDARQRLIDLLVRGATARLGRFGQPATARRVQVGLPWRELLLERGHPLGERPVGFRFGAHLDILVDPLDHDRTPWLQGSRDRSG